MWVEIRAGWKRYSCFDKIQEDWYGAISGFCWQFMPQPHILLKRKWAPIEHCFAQIIQHSRMWSSLLWAHLASLPVAQTQVEFFPDTDSPAQTITETDFLATSNETTFDQGVACPNFEVLCTILSFWWLWAVSTVNNFSLEKIIVYNLCWSKARILVRLFSMLTFLALRIVLRLKEESPRSSLAYPS